LHIDDPGEACFGIAKKRKGYRENARDRQGDSYTLPFSNPSAQD